MQYGSMPSFADCVSTHATFHKEAGKVATAINLKKFVEAETIMESVRFQYASGAVAVSIIMLQKCVHAGVEDRVQQKYPRTPKPL